VIILIFEFSRPACLKPWVDELNFGPRISTFQGLNLDVSRRLFPEVAFFENV